MSDKPENTVDKRLVPGFMAQAGKGRPKGVPNKATSLAKNVIAQAAEDLGSTARLVAWAKENEQNERLFWGTIYPKLLPLQVKAELDHQVRIAGALTWQPPQ